MKMTIRQVGENKYKLVHRLDTIEACAIGVSLILILAIILL